MPTMQFEISVDPVAHAGAVDALATVIAAGATIRLTAVVPGSAGGPPAVVAPSPTPARKAIRAPADAVTCEHCGRSFKAQQGLAAHIGRAHPVQSSQSTRRTTCKHCGKRYGSTSGLYAHEKKCAVVGGASAPTAAPTTPAGEPPALPGAASDAPIKVHVTGGTYTCAICHKQLDSQANLNRHTAQTHRMRPLTADAPERDLVADALGGC